MRAEPVYVRALDAETLITHVIVCGATQAAIDIALMLRRFGEAVTLLADHVRAEPRQLLERAGVTIVLGSPADTSAMSAAQATRARAMVIAVPSDLGCVEVALSARAAHSKLPLVCYVNDAGLPARIEPSLRIRSAVCVSTIEAVNLTGCALGDDVAGAFTLDDGLVLLRRTSVASDRQDFVGQFQSRTSMRVLMIEEPDGRFVISPSAAMPLTTGSVITGMTHEASCSAHPRLRRLVAATARAVRVVRSNTMAALGWPVAAGMRMSIPASAVATSISFAASAALVGGLRYALTINDRVFSFFEGSAGSDWAGLRPSDVAGSYNFLTLFRRTLDGKWCTAADNDTAFNEDESILVVAWRRLGPVNPDN